MDEREYKKYEEFINKYYPFSPVVSNTSVSKKQYNITHNSIDFMKLLEANDKYLNDERRNLYRSYYLLSIRVLYNFPSNDLFVQRIFLRSIIENLMKLVVLYLNINPDHLERKSFTELKDLSKSKGFHKRYPQFFEVLSDGFGSYSKDVHGSTLQQISNHDYLVSIREEFDETKVNQILLKHEKINSLMIRFFLIESPFSAQDLDVGERSKLLRLVGEEHYNLFLEKNN